MMGTVIVAGKRPRCSPPYTLLGPRYVAIRHLLLLILLLLLLLLQLLLMMMMLILSCHISRAEQ